MGTRNTEPLTAEQQKLVTDNFKLIYFIAKRMKDHPFVKVRMPERDDIEASAQYGLVCAARRFDPNKGIKFSTYAYWCMWSWIYRDANELRCMIRVPSHLWGDKPYKGYTNTELWHKEKAYADQANRMRQFKQFVKTGKIRDYEMEEHTIEDKQERNSSSRGELLLFVSRLDPIHSRAIEDRFFKNMTLNDIGIQEKISKEAVRQRIQVALRRLRTMMKVNVVPA